MATTQTQRTSQGGRFYEFNKFNNQAQKPVHPGDAAGAAGCGGPGVFGQSDIAQAKPGGPAANIDQCRNGPLANDGTDIGPTEVECKKLSGPEGWANGNAGPAHAHWSEGGSIIYRMVMEEIPDGGKNHTITIGYDTVHGGKHAIDYLTYARRTDHEVNPCAGIAALPACPLPPAAGGGLNDAPPAFDFTDDLDSTVDNAAGGSSLSHHLTTLR